MLLAAAFTAKHLFEPVAHSFMWINNKDSYIVAF
jgi:hypothetical protein